MHTAVGSSAAARALALSSQECCLSVSSPYALKVAVPELQSRCLLVHSASDTDVCLLLLFLATD